MYFLFAPLIILMLFAYLVFGILCMTFPFSPFRRDDNLMHMPSAMILYRNDAQRELQRRLSREDQVALLGEDGAELLSDVLAKGEVTGDERFEVNTGVFARIRQRPELFSYVHVPVHFSMTSTPHPQYAPSLDQHLIDIFYYLLPTCLSFPMLPCHCSIRPDSYDNFKDDAAFMRDLQKAIDAQAFGPSYSKLKKAVLAAQPLLIITARGQSPRALQTGLCHLIEATFSVEELVKIRETLELEGYASVEAYVGAQKFYPVSSKEFKEEFKVDTSMYSPEQGKVMALTSFVRSFVRDSGKASVGLMDRGDSDRLRVALKSRECLSPGKGYSTTTASAIGDRKGAGHEREEESKTAFNDEREQREEGVMNGDDTLAPLDEDDWEVDEESGLLSVGFSDDDPRNVKAIQQVFETILSPEHPNIRFVVYDTSNPSSTRKHVLEATPVKRRRPQSRQTGGQTPVAESTTTTATTNAMSTSTASTGPLPNAQNLLAKATDLAAQRSSA